jgi:hypothetical protein
MKQRNRLRPHDRITASGTTGTTRMTASGTTGITGMTASGTLGAQVFLTAPEAAALLRLSPITLSRWRVQGYGPRWTKMGPKRVCYALDARALNGH